MRLDEKINEIIKEKKIKSPVLWIRGNMYLVGTKKYPCELKAGDLAVIKTDASFERFDQVVPANDKAHQKILISHMLDNDESLEWVVEQLIQNKRLSTSGPNGGLLKNMQLSKPPLGSGRNTPKRSSVTKNNFMSKAPV